MDEHLSGPGSVRGDNGGEPAVGWPLDGRRIDDDGGVSASLPLPEARLGADGTGPGTRGLASRWFPSDSFSMPRRGSFRNHACLMFYLQFGCAHTFITTIRVRPSERGGGFEDPHELLPVGERGRERAAMGLHRVVECGGAAGAVVRDAAARHAGGRRAVRPSHRDAVAHGSLRASDRPCAHQIGRGTSVMHGYWFLTRRLACAAATQSLAEPIAWGQVAASPLHWNSLRGKVEL